MLFFLTLLLLILNLTTGFSVAPALPSRHHHHVGSHSFWPPLRVAIPPEDLLFYPPDDHIVNNGENDSMTEDGELPQPVLLAVGALLLTAVVGLSAGAPVDANPPVVPSNTMSLEEEVMQQQIVDQSAGFFFY